MGRHGRWKGDEGIALILAMFMVLVVSLMGASLVSVGKTETQSSLNYKTMSQARYAAESGFHSAANYLMNSYGLPGADATDPWTGYTFPAGGVKFNNADVILSSVVADSNYPVAAKKTAFSTDSKGTLTMSFMQADYTARAKLLSMRRFVDAYSGGMNTIQKWEITGIGTMKGAGAANVEVTAIIESQQVPAYRYAAFATYNGCDAITFGGGGHTDSYDSTAALASGVPVVSNNSGNVGTNGNLAAGGSSTTGVNGTLSTPRSGVGNCTTNNVTAASLNGQATVSGGLVQLSQAVEMKTPAAISPAPPTTSADLKKTGGCPTGTPYCAASTDGVTFTPTSSSTVVSMGNVTINANSVIHFGAGIYEWNSISVSGNAQIIIDSGPVVFRIAGKDQATPINLVGGAITNTTYKPSNLQFVYGGTGDIKLAGGAGASGLVYAPNAGLSFTGGSNWYGAVIASKIKDMGGTALHYDRNLANDGFTLGNTVMTAFSWNAK